MPRREADLARAAHALFEGEGDAPELKLLQAPAWRRDKVRSTPKRVPVSGGKA